MIVVDASALIDALTEGPLADRVDDRLEDDAALWAPHLVDAEVGHVLRRAVLRGELAPDVARAALGDLVDLPLERAAHLDLADTAWSLRHTLSYYDALYVALAAELDAPLVTLDTRLAAAPGLPAVVECLA